MLAQSRSGFQRPLSAVGVSLSVSFALAASRA
jgi:hypothetical protein